MKLSIFVGFAMMGCAIATSTIGQPLSDYRCVINRMFGSSSKTDKTVEYWRTMFVGKEFTVDRRTGTMAGALKNSYVTSPVVIDYGSDANSFKVVTTMKKEQGLGVGSNVYVLIVNEFAPSPKKPFTFMDNDDIFFGTCTHF